MAMLLDLEEPKNPTGAAPVAVLVDLAGRELEARGCGGCQGSSSDNKIRAKVEDRPADVTATYEAEGADSAS